MAAPSTKEFKLVPSRFKGIFKLAASQSVGKISTKSVGEMTLTPYFTFGLYIINGERVACSKFECLFHKL